MGLGVHNAQAWLSEASDPVDQSGPHIGRDAPVVVRDIEHVDVVIFAGG